MAFLDQGIPFFSNTNRGDGNNWMADHVLVVLADVCRPSKASLKRGDTQRATSRLGRELGSLVACKTRAAAAEFMPDSGLELCPASFSSISGQAGRHIERSKGLRGTSCKTNIRTHLQAHRERVNYRCCGVGSGASAAGAFCEAEQHRENEDPTACGWQRGKAVDKASHR